MAALDELIIERGPTPHGVGGLKLLLLESWSWQTLSHPSRGGWIEIGNVTRKAPQLESHPSRGGWIEIIKMIQRHAVIVSHPSRGGWIEMIYWRAEKW